MRGPPKRKGPAPRGGGNRADRERLERAQDTVTIDWSASYFSVAFGRETIGHVFVHRGDFLAFDRDERPLGVFATRELARKAVIEAAGRSP